MCFAIPTRLELLNVLAHAPCTVEELARASENSLSVTCEHLRALHLAGLVVWRMEGDRERYTLAGEDVRALWGALGSITPERLAEVQRAAEGYLAGEPQTVGCEQHLAPVRSAARASGGQEEHRARGASDSGRTTIDELLACARQEISRLDPRVAHAAVRAGATLIDIRSDSQIAADGTIPGALVIARNVLEWRLDPTSPFRHPAAPGLDDQVILLCNEGYQSSLAAATLRQLGFSGVSDVEGGFQAWRDAGLPVQPPATRPGQGGSG
jgi:rhodanese-related sulfurtransferase/DNA-binding transcriptional ArsR family regulator